jgi:hypothetical protein
MSYLLSFTAGALLIEESRVAAQVLLESEDLQVARSRLVDQRLITARTESSLKRTVSEVLSRLSVLPSGGVDLVANGNQDEVKQILWIACCLRYTLIRNFAEGPLAEAARTPGSSMDSKVIEVFFLNEQSESEELDSASEGTRSKLRQVLRLMIAQSGIVNDKGAMVRGLGQPRVLNLLDEISGRRVWLGGLISQ